MSLLLSKIATQLIYPMGIFALLIILAVYLVIRGKSRASLVSLTFAVAMILLSSTPKVAGFLAAGLESQFPAQAIESLPVADVAVVLGGLLGAPNGPRLETELTGASDRLHHAFRLWKAGKANRIYISGGNVFDGFLEKSESDYARNLLVEWGVDPSAIDIGENSKSTQQNASEVVTFLEQSGLRKARLFLVTSALHMPRSVALFAAEGLSEGGGSGIELIPVSTDIIVTPQTRPAVFSWIPSAAALALTTRAWHEKVGLWYHLLRG